MVIATALPYSTRSEFIFCAGLSPAYGISEICNDDKPPSSHQQSIFYFKISKTI